METKETLVVMDTTLGKIKFKLYNDTYGHNAGDMALDTIVKTVNRWQKPDNTTACCSTASSKTLWYKVAMSLPKTPR